jgi:hypothetical protein
MVDEFFHHNPPDAIEERVSRLEEKVADISFNMMTQENKFRSFREVLISWI